MQYITVLTCSSVGYVLNTRFEVNASCLFVCVGFGFLVVVVGLLLLFFGGVVCGVFLGGERWGWWRVVVVVFCCCFPPGKDSF